MTHELHELKRIGATPNESFCRGGLKNEGGKGSKVEGEELRSSKRRLKASKPCMPTNYHELSNIRHFDAFAADMVHLKKPSVGPKDLIGPPCHGAPWQAEVKREEKRKEINGRKAG